jgi:hypothetical protein
MKALCCPYVFRGFIWYRLDRLSSHSSCHLTRSHCCYELLGLISNHLVSLYIVSPGYGIIILLVSADLVDGYDAKGLVLRLISIS